MKNILVTGAGALLGQGMLRCLDFSKNNYNIVTVDPTAYATGHALGNISYTIPFVNDPAYLDRIEYIVRKENIDLILIGTDVELPLFSKKKTYLEEKHNLIVVVSPLKVIEIADDKYLTAQFLEEHNFPYPLSALTTDPDRIKYLKEKVNFPLFAKPVDGARSKGIKIIHSQVELDEITSYKNNLVVQELLTEEEGEYTTGCIVFNSECKALVSLRRDLRDGNTWRAYRDGVSKYDSQIATIAESLGADGPVNFQYRIKNGKPVIFEINCRFSGTTPLRFMFGFNEVEAVVDYYLYNTPIVKPNLRDGTVLRTFSDVFVENENLENFIDDGRTDNFNAMFYPFKNS